MNKRRQLLLIAALLSLAGCTPSETQSYFPPSPVPTFGPVAVQGATRSPSFAGSCECPYDFDQTGNVCASRSVYSRLSTARPACHPVDLQQSGIAVASGWASGAAGTAYNNAGVPSYSVNTQPVHQPSTAASAPSYTLRPAYSPQLYKPLCAENGTCYGDISNLTGRPKTTHVRGYFRKDGTYVRGHYPS
jgi:hypothetical protein